MTETLIFLLLLAFANACVINGLKKAFEFETVPNIGEADYVYAGQLDKEASMVFGNIHYFFHQWFGAKWCKPLFSCVACMASVHSTYIYWPVMLVAMPYEPSMVWMYIAYIPVTSAMAMVVQNKIV